MNKYDKCFKKYEKNNFKSWNAINLKYKLLIYKFFYDFYGEEYTRKMFNESKNGIVYDLVFGLDFFCDEVQEFVRNNIISNLNKGSIIRIFMQNLSNAKTNNNQRYIDRCMASFKKTGLIKDIKLVKDMFVIEEMDGHKIKFGNILKTKDDIKNSEGKCHEISEYIINSVGSEKWYCVTILESAIYGETRYHTFVVYNGVVHDFARNTAMLYNEYKKLFDFKVLSYVRGDVLKKNIERLKERDIEFKKSKKIAVLKYAMHKQIRTRT